MKRIFLLLMPLFIQQASADDFVLCYLYKTEVSKSDDWTRQGPVPGSYLLFDKDHYNQSFEKTVDGVTFYLRAISESAIKDGAATTGWPGYLQVSVLPPQGGFMLTKNKQAHVRLLLGVVSKIGGIKIENLFKWSDITEEETETEYYMWPSTEEKDIEKTVKAKCETLSEKEAIIRTFNRVHQQSD